MGANVHGPLHCDTSANGWNFRRDAQFGLGIGPPATETTVGGSRKQRCSLSKSSGLLSSLSHLLSAQLVLELPFVSVLSH